MSAINIIEEAFAKHQGLVSKEDINIAAELFISNKQYDKALEVRMRLDCQHVSVFQNYPKLKFSFMYIA